MKIIGPAGVHSASPPLINKTRIASVYTDAKISNVKKMVKKVLNVS